MIFVFRYYYNRDYKYVEINENTIDAIIDKVYLLINDFYIFSSKYIPDIDSIDDSLYQTYETTKSKQARKSKEKYKIEAKNTLYKQNRT